MRLFRICAAGENGAWRRDLGVSYSRIRPALGLQQILKCQGPSIFPM